jgi:hypothetical protein
MEGILIHLLNTGSRYNINYKLKHKKITDSVNKFLGTDLERLSHGDNIEKIFKKLNPKELQNFLTDIIKYLIRSKKIKAENKLFEKYFMIAIDMTQTHKLNKNILQSGEKIKGLSFQKSNGKIVYSRKVVEAKLLLFNKLSLPIMTEFISNKDEKEFEKQDCELTAAYRLMDKLKKQYPKLEICLLLDGLYPNETIFQKCKEYHWKYIMTLKEGKIPTLYQKFREFKKIGYCKEKKKQITIDTHQRFKFTEIKYLDYDINCIQIKEYVDFEGLKYHNLFITNIKVTEDNFYNIGKAGRLRWKIEHAFNKQKNLLFNLKHIYSKNENASKCYHILLQIADLIFQFMSYTFNLEGDNLLYQEFGSLIEFLAEIYISFRCDIAEKEKFGHMKHLILMEPNKKKIS